jgi:hypothetical protein
MNNTETTEAIKNSIQTIRDLVTELSESCPFNEEPPKIQSELRRLEDLIGI